MKQGQLQAGIALLPRLTKAELKTLRGLIDGLLEGTSPQDDWEYRALLDELRAQGRNVPSGFRLKGIYASLWQARLPAISALLVKFEGGSARGIAYALLRLLYRLLMADMRQRNIPLTPGSVISNLTRLEDVLEKELPGYLHSGLSRMIVQAIGGKHVGNA